MFGSESVFSSSGNSIRLSAFSGSHFFSWNVRGQQYLLAGLSWGVKMTAKSSCAQ